jgi:hypothetical protein
MITMAGPIYWLRMGLGLGRHGVFSWADILRTCVVLICDFHAFSSNILRLPPSSVGRVELHEFNFLGNMEHFLFKLLQL